MKKYIFTVSCIIGCAAATAQATPATNSLTIRQGITTDKAIINVLGTPDGMKVQRGKTAWVYKEKVDITFPRHKHHILGKITLAQGNKHAQVFVFQFNRQEKVTKFYLDN